MREILIIITISVVFLMLSCSVDTKKSLGSDGDILFDDGDVVEADESISADGDNAEADESVNADGDIAETDDDPAIPDNFVDEDDVELNDDNDEFPDLNDDNADIDAGVSDDVDDEVSDEDIDLLPPDTKHTTVLFGTDKNDFGSSLAMDSSGNIYMAGSTEGNLDGQINSGGQNAFVIKFDSYGNKLWTKLYGTEKIDSATSIKIDSSGNIYLTGSTEGTFNGNVSKGSYDAFLLKLDANGEVLWSKQTGTDGADTSMSIVLDNDENIYISGYVDGEDTAHVGTSDAFIAKFNSDGTEVWLKRWGSEGLEITHRATFHNEFIYIVGATNGDVGGTGFLGGYWDAFLTKIDTDGNISWSKQLGTDGSDAAYSLQFDSESNIFICGTVGIKAELEYSVSVTKLNSDGSLNWIESWGSGYGTAGNNMISDEFGNFYVSGMAGDDFDGYKNSGSGDVLLIKLDSSGKKMWTKLWGGEGMETSNSSLIDKYGNIYVTGITDSGFDGQTSSGGFDIFLTKFNAEDL